MTESADIKNVVRVLGTVPPKNLRIVELLNQIPVKDGDLDPEILAKRADEIEEAKEEAEAYKKASASAIYSLRRLLYDD